MNESLQTLDGMRMEIPDEPVLLQCEAHAEDYVFWQDQDFRVSGIDLIRDLH